VAKATLFTIPALPCCSLETFQIACYAPAQRAWEANGRADAGNRS
jgi:hypothetical protein